MPVQPTPVLSVDACDPQHLIRGALGGGDAGETWSARELYLAWLMNLPNEIDAAHAAALLLERAVALPGRSGPVLDLLALLRTTTAYPRERLEPGPACRSRLH
jgi:hypothetical protein